MTESFISIALQTGPKINPGNRVPSPHSRPNIQVQLSLSAPSLPPPPTHFFLRHDSGTIFRKIHEMPLLRIRATELTLFGGTLSQIIPIDWLNLECYGISSTL